jgi:EmrB/QacA subfamily drug resistance transporter
MSSGRNMIFIAACLAIFMVSVEGTIVATAIPTIVGQLGGLRLFSWLFGIYFLTQAVSIPIYGRLADIYGRKRLILIAVTLFLIGSILSGFAHSMVMLIVYRGLQGLGAGGVMPLALTIIGDIYSGKERAAVQGYLSSVWAISAITGPLLGAFLIDHAGWPTIFWLNVPFGILCIAVIVRYFHETVELGTESIDYVGSFLLATGAGSLMFVLVMLGNLPATLAFGLSIVAVLLIAALIVHELQTEHPMMPLRLFRVRVIGVANASSFVIGAQAIGLTAFLPTYVQGAMGLSAVMAGTCLGLMSLNWTIGSLIASRMLGRTSFRTTALSGGALLIIGSATLIALVPYRGVWWAFGGATLLGLGFGMINLVFTVTTQSAVGWEQRGAVTASNQFMRMLGSAIGTAALGAVFNLGLYARLSDAGEVVASMMDPVKRSGLAPVDVDRYAVAMAGSLHGIFLIVGALGIVVVLLILALPARLMAHDPAPA